MTTYYNGLEVPKINVEYFEGITLAPITGTYELSLQYPAVSQQTIVITPIARPYLRGYPSHLYSDHVTLILQIFALEGAAIGDPIEGQVVPTVLTGHSFSISYPVLGGS